MSFEEYIEKMEARRFQERTAAFNAELERGLRELSHDEAVERMFLLLGCPGETANILPAYAENGERLAFLG